ncbi:hypothetical protein AWJ20_3380 [Sugiyamaella lignohabitans]|uniref:Histone H2A.Z-specific chaperone CHZ1 n=1 Tax=Sugiyamaella lignohabitans TaxID=796027 RepID=A0A167FV42_9ASCO|nr:uncharacterized protein AWJ20_3380 [Sugiyamaella lignohabitans]ANB15739.1 hypothetical protein AWJ20_3380 [Sugiyamaella lignohabitans]
MTENEETLKRKAEEVPVSTEEVKKLKEETISSGSTDEGARATSEESTKAPTAEATTESKPESVEAVSEPIAEQEKSDKGKGKAKLRGKVSSRYADAPEEDNEDEDDEDDEEDEEGDDIEVSAVVEEEEEEDSLEEIDTSNIIQGRRTRGVTIDYQKTLEKMQQEEGTNGNLDDEDEDVDADFKAPADEPAN